VTSSGRGGWRSVFGGTDGVVLLILAVVVGVGVGLGSFTFLYARGLSYLTDHPEACANCHVMRSHYDAWVKSSHRAVAVCNDCHTPAGFLAKYLTKMTNGFRHSSAFTSGAYPDPIRITERSRGIVEDACRKCHDEMVQAIFGAVPGEEPPSCVRCHPGVGHAE
jgi:cytochrome c nitrite reductase small subunit